MLRRSSANLSILLHTLIFLIVAASALNYWSVAEYAINVSWDAYYYQKTSYISRVPNWQKGLKDLFALLLLVGSLWFPRTTPNQYLVKNKQLKICYALSLAILGIAIARSIASDFTLFMIISSLRPFLAVVAAFVFCHRHFQPYYFRWVLEAINVLALIQIYYAYWQRRSAITYNGFDWLHSGSARAVGTFIGPNTMALFLALVFYLNYSVLPPHKFRFLILVLCGIAVFFTGSRTGLVIIMMIFLIESYKKITTRYKFNIFKGKLLAVFIGVPLFSTLFILIIRNTNSISGRASSSTVNDGRVGIFESLINQSDAPSLLFGHHLGFGSNIVQTLAQLSVTDRLEKDFFLSDSTLASVLAQFGILGLLIIISIIYIFLAKNPQVIYTNNPSMVLMFTGKLTKEKTSFVIYLISTFATIIIFEFYAVLPIIISLLFYLKMPDIIYSRNKY